MTAVMAGFIIFLIGLLITIGGILYRPPVRRRELAASTRSWEKVLDAVIKWINQVIEGKNPRKQLITLGILVMIGGLAVIIWPLVAAGAETGGGVSTISPTPTTG